ncbi:MAG: SUMF1/EgtB/PvdO family nonheme iron enzyme [Rhodopirellula sp.]|nr:SUMF1/EgtB/PvdO family nonheme iron enzyme [Rhodopirellula sp.]
MSDQKHMPSRDRGDLHTRAKSPAEPRLPPGSDTAVGPVPENDRYEVLGEAGAGGMGQVWKALDRRLERLVAIKRIHPGLAASPELLSRFRREARVVAGLQHPHIVQVYDLDEDATGLYQVMQWIEGQNLQQLLQAEGPLPAPRAASIIACVADALATAHDAGVIHRDVKPANILLNERDVPYLTDFGLVRIELETESLNSAGGTLTNAVLGTVEFMAPEQSADPRRASAASDQWSLGATLHQIVTGRPVRGMRESRIPHALREAILTALEYEPEDRFGSLREFAATLSDLTDTTSTMPASQEKSAVSQPDQDQSSSPSGTGIVEAIRELQSRAEGAKSAAEELVSDRQDFAEAVRLLEEIPKHLRDESRLDELRRKRDRVAELLAFIEPRAREAHLDDLREPVQELLELQPQHLEMQQLLAILPQEPVRPEQPPLLVAPFDAATARRGQEQWAAFLGKPVEWENSVGMKFRLIPPGEFLMGSPEDEPKRILYEQQHRVRITKPFYCGVYPVTQAEYQSVMDRNPSFFKSVSGQDRSQFPVDQVSWDDAQKFLAKLLLQSGESGGKYRLLTEAEWEYSCRAGTPTPFWFAGDLNGKQANCEWSSPYPNGTSKGPYLERTSPVGSYAANAFGLYDMHGNVWEWCSDWYDADWYGQSPVEDPVGPGSGSSRVLRGGSWYSLAPGCRSAFRCNTHPAYRGSDYGFRVLCEL